MPQVPMPIVMPSIRRRGRAANFPARQHHAHQRRTASPRPATDPANNPAQRPHAPDAGRLAACCCACGEKSRARTPCTIAGRGRRRPGWRHIVRLPGAPVRQSAKQEGCAGDAHGRPRMGRSPAGSFTAGILATEPGEPRRGGGPCPIRVHPRASAAKISCLLCRQRHIARPLRPRVTGSALTAPAGKAPANDR